MRDLLLLFLKWPEPGTTKTRLVPALGPEAAAGVYRLLAEAAIGATRPRGRGRGYERILCFTPGDAKERIGRWFPNEPLWPQPEGDLGQRMESAFEEAFRRGAERVALVGTDIPGVTRDLVARSFEALASADLVLGPAHDGGYYLVATARPLPELFRGIAWSTSGVLDATRDRAASLGLRTSLLEALNDVDVIDDLASGWDGLEPILGREPRVRDAVARALRRPGTVGSEHNRPVTEIKTYLQVLGFIDEKPLRFAIGDVIFAAGQAGDKMYIVRSGSVDLKVGEILLETVVPGGVFGELALIDPAPRSATAVAGFDCSLAAVGVEQFHQLVKKVPNLALEVMKVMARRIRRTNPAS